MPDGLEPAAANTNGPREKRAGARGAVVKAGSGDCLRLLMVIYASFPSSVLGSAGALVRPHLFSEAVGEPEGAGPLCPSLFRDRFSLLCLPRLPGQANYQVKSCTIARVGAESNVK